MTNQTVIEAFAKTLHPFLYRNEDGSLIMGGNGVLRFFGDGHSIKDNTPIRPFQPGLKVSREEYQETIADAVGDWFSDRYPPFVYGFYGVGTVSKEDIVAKLKEEEGFVAANFFDAEELIKNLNLFYVALAKAWDRLEGKSYPDDIYTKSLKL